MAEHHRKNKADRHPTSGIFVRFDKDTRERIDAEAKARDVTPTWIVRRLIQEGLNNLVPVQPSLTRGGSDASH